MRPSLIVKSNDLIQGFTNMTKNEYLFTLYLISKIKKNDKNFRKQKVTVEEFSNLINVDKNRVYSYLKEFESNLISKKITINYNNGNRLNMTWFSYIMYYHDMGMIEVAFNNALTPYLLELDTNFTKYFLDNVRGLKSMYSQRIFELLKQYEPIGQREFEIEELKILLNAPLKYKYNNLKERALFPAQEELKEKTDIYFEFNAIKTGRKVTAIKFYIHSNKKITSNDEMAATKAPVKQITGQIDFETQELINKVKQIIKEPLTEKNIYDLLKIAENDINKIQVAYEVAEQNTKPIKTLYGFLEDAIKNNYIPSVGKENVKKSKFANFQERKDWDFKEIERLSREQIKKELEIKERLS